MLDSSWHWQVIAVQTPLTKHGKLLKNNLTLAVNKALKYTRQCTNNDLHSKLCHYLHCQLFQLSLLSTDSPLTFYFLFLHNTMHSVNQDG